MITYDKTDDKLTEFSRFIELGFSEAGCKVKRLTPEKTGIPEILEADILVFGATYQSASAYAEIHRIFKGINLAGRFSGLFVTGGRKTVEFLNSMIADTGMSVYEENIFCDKVDGSKGAVEKGLKSWAGKITSRQSEWVSVHGV